MRSIKGPTSGSSQPSADPAPIAWSGSLDEAELNRPGGLLIAALISHANARGHQIREMAEELGLTYGYINQLRKGIREVSQISDDVVLACARYLCVPKLTVMMLSGKLTIEDAYEPTAMMATEIPAAMEFILRDPEWMALVTPEVRNGSLETQFLVVKLYEKATNRRILSEAITPITIASAIASLREVQAQRAEKLGKGHEPASALL